MYGSAGIGTVYHENLFICRPTCYLFSTRLWPRVGSDDQTLSWTEMYSELTFLMKVLLDNGGENSRFSSSNALHLSLPGGRKEGRNREENSF